MKIEQGPRNVVIPRTSTPKKDATQSGQAVKKPGDAFSLQITAAVERMKAPTTDNDAVRLDKVEAIRNQLASGTYNLSGKDVANKILKALKG